MKIYSFATYFDEQDIFDIKYQTEKNYVDEIHICEANRTFKNAPKEYNFHYADDSGKIKYHKLDVSKKFVSMNVGGKLRLAYKRFSPSFYHRITANPAWHNEIIQRSSLGYKNGKPLSFQDDDILIFSDVDEILMPDKIKELIDLTFLHGIITVKLHFTMFYLNLFSENWSGSPDYSYRLFIMTGQYFKKHKIKYDKLRKQGENNRLNDSVYCFPDFAGYHHSWLGDEDFVAKKLIAYSHVKEHKETSSEFIHKCVRGGVSLFEGHKLSVRDTIQLLPYIEENREGKFKKYFYKNS